MAAFHPCNVRLLHTGRFGELSLRQSSAQPQILQLQPLTGRRSPSRDLTTSLRKVDSFLLQFADEIIDIGAAAQIRLLAKGDPDRRIGRDIGRAYVSGFVTLRPTPRTGDLGLPLSGRSMGAAGVRVPRKTAVSF